MERLAALLDDMTGEMRVQFELFRSARDGGRGEAKGAVEAMSVIIRTLEKIEALRRQIAEDGRAAEEGEDGAYEELMVALLSEIDHRARERALALARAASGADDPAAAEGPADEV